MRKVENKNGFENKKVSLIKASSHLLIIALCLSLMIICGFTLTEFKGSKPDKKYLENSIKTKNDINCTFLNLRSHKIVKTSKIIKPKGGYVIKNRLFDNRQIEIIKAKNRSKYNDLINNPSLNILYIAKLVA